MGGGAPGVGLALGGGVVYSIAAIGVAQVLEEQGIPVRAVAGTSGGALVGAGIAAGLPARDLARAAQTLTWRDLVRLAPRQAGLFHGDRIARFVERLTGCRRIEELRLPFTAVCADILTSTEVRLDRGPLGAAVRASCAIPGLFQPVPWEEWLLVDGGILNNVPVNAAQDRGPGVVLAVDVLSRSASYQGRLRSGVQIAVKAYHTMVRRLTEDQLAQAALVVQPDMAGCSVLNFRDVAEVVGRGREACRPLLPRLRALLSKG